MNQSDLRYIKTEDLIKQAFLSCASEYDIQDVHIKDICAKARISRNAFYSHYENKYQVLEQICRETEERMLNELNPEIIKMLSNNTMYSVPSPDDLVGTIDPSAKPSSAKVRFFEFI